MHHGIGIMYHLPPQATGSQAASPQTNYPQTACILIVEDNHNHRQIMKLLLEHHFSYRVIEAANGEQAIELAQREKPILILMDLALPLVSGLEATKAIHAGEETKDIPTVVVSSECWDDEIREQGGQSGAVDCLDKILLFEHLEPLIAPYLKPPYSER